MGIEHEVMAREKMCGGLLPCMKQGAMLCRAKQKMHDAGGYGLKVPCSRVTATSKLQGGGLPTAQKACSECSLQAGHVVTWSCTMRVACSDCINTSTMLYL